MGSSILATCTTGRPGWMITALESVRTSRNATCSQTGSPSLRATTGDARATSTSGTPWVRPRTTAPFLSPKLHYYIRLLLIPGQYYETCDGSSSSVTINTTNIPLGAEVMEVMVYRKRERRKYSPLSVDNTVFYVTGGDTFGPFHLQNQENSEFSLSRLFPRQDPGGRPHLPEGSGQPVGERFFPRQGRGLQSSTPRPQRLPENGRRPRLHLGLQGRQPAGDAPQRDHAHLQPAGHHEREAGGGGGVPGRMSTHLRPLHGYGEKLKYTVGQPKGLWLIVKTSNCTFNMAFAKEVTWQGSPPPCPPPKDVNLFMTMLVFVPSLLNASSSFQTAANPPTEPGRVNTFHMTGFLTFFVHSRFV